MEPILERLRQGEHLAFLDTTARRKDGSLVDVSLSISPIRDPRGVVTGISSVARDMTELKRAEAERHALQQQVQDAERLETLTRQLLIFSHREVNQPKALYLNAVIDEIRSLLSVTTGDHVDLRVEPAPGLPAVIADPGQLGQVLLNLALNARGMTGAVPAERITELKPGIPSCTCPATVPER
jgi:two-component system cell cycle sensor histidine kinase/response regulator CckA